MKGVQKPAMIDHRDDGQALPEAAEENQSQELAEQMMKACELKQELVLLDDGLTLRVVERACRIFERRQNRLGTRLVIDRSRYFPGDQVPCIVFLIKSVRALFAGRGF